MFKFGFEVDRNYRENESNGSGRESIVLWISP